MQELIRLISALERLSARRPGAHAADGRDDDEPATPVERLAVLERMVDESHRIQRAWFSSLLDQGRDPGARAEDSVEATRERGRAAAPPSSDDHPDDPDAALVELLRGLQRVVLEHPIAAQAAFSALVAEGRRYAQTPEGVGWARRLEGSELLRQGRRVWEAASLGMLEPNTDAALPSSYIDALLSAADHPDVEALLRRLQNADEAAAGAEEEQTDGRPGPR